MPGETKEPQSYGSERDWLTGHTGQRRETSSEEAAAEHRPFYEAWHERSEERKGGKPSEDTTRNAPRGSAPSSEPSTPVQKVTSTPAGAKRGGYFRSRDYD